jgi:gamma-glutamyl:cysteine ligase YbdK (ATP-grasp superfamily)
MASLVESLLSTLENNTRSQRDGTDLFERTMIVDAPLTRAQLLALQSYLKVVGGQFLQRVDAFAAVDLQEKMVPAPGENAAIRAGLQCFLFVEPDQGNIRLRDAIEFDESKH